LYNILFISSEFPPGPGGIGEHAYNITNELRKKNINVDIITRSRFQFPHQHYDKTIPMTILRYSSLTQLFNCYYNFFNQQIKRQKRYDWVFVSGLNHVIAIGILQYFVKIKSLTILHGHEPLMVKNIKKLILFYALKKMDLIVAVSNFSKKSAQKLINDKNIIVINNGLDPYRIDKYCNINKKKNPIQYDGPIRLITVGRLCKRKGQHNIINALENLEKYYPEIEYHMVGLPQDITRLKKLALDKNVQNKVIFHGFLDDKKMFNLLQDCDIFLLLSENQNDGDVEGFGIVILEANYLGLPCIGSIGCGIEDAIDDNINGILINPLKKIELIEALDKIIKSYNYYSYNARLFSRNKTWKNVAKSYLNLLK